MGFKLYSETVGSENLNSTSPAYLSRYFEIIPTKPFGGVERFFGIAEEAPKLKYSSEWGSGPTAVFAEKVKEFTNHQLVKAFASASGKYTPVIATDSWTQKYPVKGTIIEVPLKFRAYPTAMYNTMDYFSAIRNLFVYTTPGKFDFSVGIENINNAIDKAAQIGWDGGSAIKVIMDAVKNLRQADESIPWSEISTNVLKVTNENPDSLDKTLNAVDTLYKDKYSTTFGKATAEIVKGFSSILYILNHVTEPEGAGCQTFSLKYGSLYTKTYDQWVISNWSFKPAVNTTVISKNDQEVICPIYVDINITLRTAGQVGTGDLANLANVT